MSCGRRSMRIMRGRLLQRGDVMLAPAAVGRRLATGADDVADEVHLPPAGEEDGQHRTGPHDQQATTIRARGSPRLRCLPPRPEGIVGAIAMVWMETGR